MKKTLLLLLFSVFAFGQEIVSDQETSIGRTTVFKVGSDKVKIEATAKINEFTEINGLLTSDGSPYFAVKFYEYENNSNSVLFDLYNAIDFKETFPNGVISYDKIHNITSTKNFVDSKKRNVFGFTKIYALSKGLLYVFINIPIENKNEDQAKQKANDVIKWMSVEPNYYEMHANLQN